MHHHNHTTSFGTIGLTFNAKGQLSELSLNPVKVLSPADKQPACATSLNQITTWLDAYFAGKNPSMASLPLAPQGTPYQQQVWQTISQVPYGFTASYKDIASKLKSGPRAVGGANGKNPIPLIIPCHRIVAADGTLGGYSGPGGLVTKAKLLKHEGANA